MDIQKYFNQNNLHHAYLIETNNPKSKDELLVFLNKIEINNKSSDFFEISVDTFGIKDAKILRNMSQEKGYSSEKKVFLISTNLILKEAQNALLKIFEEPIFNMHFFIIVPDISSLLKTFISRFYVIKLSGNTLNTKEAENFLQMSLNSRIEYIKTNFGKSSKDDEEDRDSDSTRTRALVFLNALELILYKSQPPYVSKNILLWDQIYQVRRFLNQPGSSIKNLLDSVAVLIN